MIPLGLLCLPVTGNSGDTDTGDSVRSKVEEFVGHPIEAIFCEPLEKERGSPVDPETCDYLSRKSLESCWDKLTSVLPNLRKPVEEYSSWLEPDTLDQLREAVHRCVEAGTFLNEEDRQMYWDLRSGRTIGNEEDEKALVASWMSAIESAVALPTENRESILRVVEAFLASDYMAVHTIRDDLVIAVVGTTGELVTLRLDSPPDWIYSMRSLGFTSADRVSASTSIYGELPVVTDEHEFLVRLIFEEVEDLPECNADFEAIDCGVCIAMTSNDFDVAVTWISRELIRDLTEPSVDGAYEESAEGADRNSDHVTRCIGDGIEEARSLQRVQPRR